MAQADYSTSTYKSNGLSCMINALLDTIDTVQPAPGTRPMEILKKHLKDYINGTEATTHNHLKVVMY